MGQYDVLEFLEKEWKKRNKKYYSVKELSKILERKCSVSCTKLRYHGIIDFKEERPNGNMLHRYFVYRWKP